MDTRKDRVGEDEYSVAKICCCCCTAGLAFPVEQEVVVCYPLGYGFPFSKPALSSVPSSCYLDSWSPPLTDLSFSAICLNVCVCSQTDHRCWWPVTILGLPSFVPSLANAPNFLTILLFCVLGSNQHA